MKKKTQKIKYTEGTIGRMELVEDFLPRPEELVFKDVDTVKVTMQLKKSSVDFFKKEAKRVGGSYQAMIRNLLDRYVTSYQAK